MELVHKAEKALEEPIGALPALPKETRRSLAVIWPWLALVAGILQLLAAWWLFDWARELEKYSEWADRLTVSYGVSADNTGLTVWVWLAIIVLVIDAIILLAAFPKLQKKQKAGWDLLLLGALINLVYGIVSLFIDGRGGFSGLFGALVGSAIGFYLLFQVREYFGGGTIKASSTKKKDK